MEMKRKQLNVIASSMRAYDAVYVSSVSAARATGFGVFGEFATRCVAILASSVVAASIAMSMHATANAACVLGSTPWKSNVTFDVFALKTIGISIISIDFQEVEFCVTLIWSSNFQPARDS